MVKDNGIDDGKDRSCSTTVKAGSDDQQLTAVDETPKQPDLLKSFDDWSNLSFSHLDFTIVSGGNVRTGTRTRPHDGRGVASIHQRSDGAARQARPERSGHRQAWRRPDLQREGHEHWAGTGGVQRHSRRRIPTAPSSRRILTSSAPDSELTRSRSFAIPANACPGDFTSASASMTFKDFAGQSLTAAATTPLQILDVAPPTVDVSLSPNVLWPPDHKFVDVTATITSRDNCDSNSDGDAGVDHQQRARGQEGPGHSRRCLRNRRSLVLLARRARHGARSHGTDLHRHLPNRRPIRERDPQERHGNSANEQQRQIGRCCWAAAASVALSSGRATDFHHDSSAECKPTGRPTAPVRRKISRATNGISLSTPARPVQSIARYCPGSILSTAPNVSSVSA